MERRKRASTSTAFNGHAFRDRWGHIHARRVHASFYDPQAMQPSRLGIEYLLPIFTDAIGPDDVEHMRQTMFDEGNLFRPYHSVNTDVNKRIRCLEERHDGQRPRSGQAHCTERRQSRNRPPPETPPRRVS